MTPIISLAVFSSLVLFVSCYTIPSGGLNNVKRPVLVNTPPLSTGPVNTQTSWGIQKPLSLPTVTNTNYPVNTNWNSNNVNRYPNNAYPNNGNVYPNNGNAYPNNGNWNTNTGFPNNGNTSPQIWPCRLTPFPGDNRRYYETDNGYTWERICAEGTVFDTTGQNCGCIHGANSFVNLNNNVDPWYPNNNNRFPNNNNGIPNNNNGNIGIIIDPWFPNNNNNNNNNNPTFPNRFPSNPNTDPWPVNVGFPNNGNNMMMNGNGGD